MSRWAKFWMVAALLAVVALAFRVSWNALKDVAGAIGADPTAATVYPLVVDGLMALALVAALVLTGRDRRLALRVLAGYTAASLVLNYVHGLVPTLHESDGGRLADWAPAHWALVLLASSLPVGSIYYGSELVAKVLHHRPEANETADSRVNRSGSDLPEPEVGEVDWPLYESADLPPAPAPVTLLVEPTEPPAETAPTIPAVQPVAARSGRAARPTRPVPQSARAARPTRTPEQLLNEARSATTDWPDEQLTADRIRSAVRTSADKARTLRDALKAERVAGAEVAERPALHAVPDPTPAPAPVAEQDGPADTTDTSTSDAAESGATKEAS
ncbi:DUF2637 domain-containing protein [Kitasatospora sp. NPDC004240]